jgi:prophage antirepressor-like protein
MRFFYAYRFYGGCNSGSFAARCAHRRSLSTRLHPPPTFERVIGGFQFSMETLMSNNKIQEFQFQTTAIRVQTDENGNPLFCAKDICDVLGYANSRKAISDHCKVAGVTNRYISHESGTKQATFIDEGNLYRLIIKSNKPEAEPFEAWVCDEVLPSIRKTGGYLAEPAPAQELLDTQRRLIASQQDQIAYIRQACDEKTALIQAESKKAVRDVEDKWRHAERKVLELQGTEGYWQGEFDKLLRSKRPVTHHEAIGILHALYVLDYRTDAVAKDHYRSVGAIRKVRRNWRAYALPEALQLAVLAAVAGVQP